MALKATTALKAISKVSDAQLALVLNKLDKKTLTNVSKACAMILDSCSSTEKIKRPSRTTKIPKMEIAKSLVYKIIAALDKYDKTDAIEDVNLSLKMGSNFAKMNEQQIQNLHDSLLQIGSNCNQIKLLSYCERGRLYSFLKSNNRTQKSWKEVCTSLKLSPNTAKRYIAFYNFCLSYPRILICHLTFETIMAYADSFINIFRKNIKLESRLMTPLKSVKIKVEAVVKESSLPQAGDPLTKFSRSETDKWNPGWEEVDILNNDSDDSDDTVSNGSTEYVDCDAGYDDTGDDDTSDDDNDVDHNVDGDVDGDAEAN